MITNENYKELTDEFASLKFTALSTGLTAEQFLGEINKKSPFAEVFIKFFEKVSDDGDIFVPLKEFMEVVFGVKIDRNNKNAKK